MNTAFITDRYPTTPMQQGMIFNNLYTTEAGVDIVQIICDLHEPLHLASFQQAWQYVCERHIALRSAFRWEGTASPVQEAYRHIELPWKSEDWRGLSRQEQADRLTHALLSDRCQGFSLWQAPLVRLALFRRAEADYTFLFTFHHAILDGRSLPILLSEAFEAYSALVQNDVPHFPPVSPYQDALAQFQGQDQAEDEAFWSRLLQGFERPTPLPGNDRSEQTITPGESHAEREIRLSPSVSTALKRLADQSHLTLNTIIQGAWAFLLSRYSGQKDVVFGVTRSCRPAQQDASTALVGLFLNTLPLRVQVFPEKPLLPWLQELRAQNLALRAHQLTPLMQVQQWSAVPKGTPLFESIVVFENQTLHSNLRSRGGDWQQRSFFLRRKPTYPLALYVFAQEQLLIDLVYDRQRFSSATIEHMLEMLRLGLEEITRDPERELGTLPLLSEAERQKVLFTWNATQRPYPQDTCIHQLFEEQVARTPDALAVQDGTRCITYQQLNASANQLAHLLRAQGVGPEVRVALLMERSLEFIIGQIAILKAGGAFVPLDPAYPAERLNYIFENINTSIVLTLHGQGNGMEASHLQWIYLDDTLILVGWSDKNVDNHTLPGNVAYTIYTSGSTGYPKGVEIQHQSLVNLVHWHCQTYTITGNDRATQLASPAFDAAVWEIWPHLVAGASLHIPDKQLLLKPRELIGWLVEHGITLCFLPTPLGEAVLQEAWPAGNRLRALLIGGDRLHAQPETTVPFRVYNQYGPTESTVVTTWTEVASGEKGKTPPIGRPIANTQVYLLDERLAPVPIGVVGELFIGGSSLARGYLNQPALSAEHFLPHPFSDTPGARLYRSGDLACYREDGSIEFLGRQDSQVKIRGFRIELGEIETALLQHDAIADAVVLARTGKHNEPYLVAYIVPLSEQKLEDYALRHVLSRKLPAYMLPSVFLFLDAFPLTLNGKIDQRALPHVEPEVPARSSYQAPRTHLEKKLVEIWSHVLHREPPEDPPGLNDNFFALGGHSLLAAQAVLQIKDVLHIDVPVRCLFDAPTIASLSAVLEKIRQEQHMQTTPAILPLDRKSYRVSGRSEQK